MDDPYKVLGITREEAAHDPAVIKKAYRRMSFNHHPDMNKDDPSATTKFLRVQKAWETIGTEEGRKAFEAQGCDSQHGSMPMPMQMPSGMRMRMPRGGTVQMHMPHMGHAQAPDEFLRAVANGDLAGLFGDGIAGDGVRVFHMGMSSPEQLFGMPTHAGPALGSLRQPKTIVEKVTITLQQAYSGCKVPLEITRTVHDAYGARDESETLYVEIPGGIDTNETIVLPAKGNVIGRAVGDVKVFVEVSKDSNFQRDALDLIHTRPITLKEALCGFSFQLRHLDGQKFQLNNERGTLIGPGSRKVLKGLGIRRGDTVGDLIIQFEVAMPKSLPATTIDALARLL